MPHPPLYGDRLGIGGDLTHRMCQIPHPSITIQCQIPTLYIHTHICAGTRANACTGQKPHPWGVISWRIPTKPHPYPLQGGVGCNIDRRIAWRSTPLVWTATNYKPWYSFLPIYAAALAPLLFGLPLITNHGIPSSQSMQQH